MVLFCVCLNFLIIKGKRKVVLITQTRGDLLPHMCDACLWWFLLTSASCQGSGLTSSVVRRPCILICSGQSWATPLSCIPSGLAFTPDFLFLFFKVNCHYLVDALKQARMSFTDDHLQFLASAMISIRAWGLMQQAGFYVNAQTQQRLRSLVLAFHGERACRVLASW